MQELAVRFEQEPSLSEFVNLCDEFAKSSTFGGVSTENVKVYSAILQSRLIHTFSSSDKGYSSLVKIFKNPAGLGCLASRLRDAPGSETEELLELIQTILDNVKLKDLLQTAATETTNLIWGSRILNVASTRDSNEFKQHWIGDLKLYVSWLARSMIEENIIDPRLFDKGIKLGAPREFLEPFMSHLPLLKDNYSPLRPAQHEFIITHGLMALLPTEPSVSGRILFNLDVDPEAFIRLCYKIPGNLSTIRAGIVLAREKEELFSIVMRVLIKEWADPSHIALSPLLNQQALTQLLIGASLSLTSEQAAQISHSPTFTAGVSNHLQSSASSTRELGTLLAEVFVKRSGANLEFGMNYSGYDWWIGRDEMASSSQTQLSPYTVSDSGTQLAAEPLKNILSGSKSQDSDGESRNSGDSDDEDVSDEEVDPPYFLKDLVAYLRSEKYPEVQSGLDHGANLISRKATFGSEVPHYAEEILSAACSLNDKFSINNFNEKRQSILDAVIVADPTQAPVLVHMFVTGDWSLAQRQSLLATLAYAAHTLAKGEAPSAKEMLPSRLHKLFISDSDRLAIDQISEGRPKQVGDNNSEVSRKSTTSNVRKRNNFSAVSNKFFFPLLAAQPPLRKSSYDAIVYSQWLRTLGVIVAEAYPSKYIPEMVSEMWPLLTNLVKQSAMKVHEVVVLEALYASLSMVISVGGAIIVQNFGSELGAVFDQLVEGMENLPAAGPQAITSGRAAAAQLARMLQQVQDCMLGGGSL